MRVQVTVCPAVEQPKPLVPVGPPAPVGAGVRRLSKVSVTTVFPTVGPPVRVTVIVAELVLPGPATLGGLKFLSIVNPVGPGVPTTRLATALQIGSAIAGAPGAGGAGVVAVMHAVLGMLALFTPALTVTGMVIVGGVSPGPIAVGRVHVTRVVPAGVVGVTGAGAVVQVNPFCGAIVPTVRRGSKSSTTVVAVWPVGLLLGWTVRTALLVPPGPTLAGWNALVMRMLVGVLTLGPMASHSTWPMMISSLMTGTGGSSGLRTFGARITRRTRTALMTTLVEPGALLRVCSLRVT